MELGPEDVSLLERCPHFRGCYVQASMELGPEDVSLLERYPHFRGYTNGCVLSTSTHTSLQGTLPEKKKRLTKSRSELKTVTEKWEELRKEVGVAKETVGDAKNSMQANRSR